MTSVSEEKLVIDINAPVPGQVSDSGSALVKKTEGTEEEEGREGSKAEHETQETKVVDTAKAGETGSQEKNEQPVILSEMKRSGMESKDLPPVTSNGQPETKVVDAIMTQSERNSIWEDLKKSMKDLGRIPYLLILPLINLIQGQYEKIPESRRQGFARMAGDVKTSGKGGIQKIKEWWAKRDEKKSGVKIESKDVKVTEETKVVDVPNGTKITEDTKGTEGANETKVVQETKAPEVTEGSKDTMIIPQPKATEDSKFVATIPEPQVVEGQATEEVVKEAHSISDTMPDIGPSKTNNEQPVSTTINVEKESEKQLKVTTTIVEEKKTIS